VPTRALNSAAWKASRTRCRRAGVRAAARAPAGFPPIPRPACRTPSPSRFGRNAVGRFVPGAPHRGPVMHRLRHEPADRFALQRHELAVVVVFVELRAEEHHVNARIVPSMARNNCGRRKRNLVTTLRSCVVRATRSLSAPGPMMVLASSSTIQSWFRTRRGNPMTCMVDPTREKAGPARALAPRRGLSAASS